MVEKACYSCKYHENGFLHCVLCDEEFTEWEEVVEMPARVEEPEKLCSDCVHGERKGWDFPCNRCHTPPNAHVMWEGKKEDKMTFKITNINKERSPEGATTYIAEELVSKILVRVTIPNKEKLTKSELKIKLESALTFCASDENIEIGDIL